MKREIAVEFVPKPKSKQEEHALAMELRKLHNLPDDALIAKVVHCTGANGWGLLRPLGRSPAYEKRGIYCSFKDLGEHVPGKRLCLEQIVTYSMDINSKRGPRAVELRVLLDPLKNERIKQAA